MQLGTEAESRVNTGEPGQDSRNCHFVFGSLLTPPVGFWQTFFMRVGQNHNQFGSSPETHSISIWSENIYTGKPSFSPYSDSQ